MINLWQNPIFAREFSANARSLKSLIFTFLTLLVLSSIIIILWPRTGVFSESNSDELFSVFLTINLALIILLTPAFSSTSITSEKENRSFDLLFTSLLSPAEIMAGKLFAALGMTLAMVFISMPITAICALSGGISFELLLKAYGVIFTTTVAYGLFGLAVSSVCFRSFTALMVTYVGIMVMAGATWLPSVLLSELLPGLAPVWRGIRALSPFEALFALNYPEHFELVVPGLYAGSSFVFFLIGMFIMGLLFLLVFCFRILRPARQRVGKNEQYYSDLKTTLKRRLIFPFYLIDPLRRKKPIALWRNPILVAELRSKIFGKPKFIIRSLAACFILSLGILALVGVQFATQLNPDMVRLVAVVFQVGVVALFAPAVCTGSITEERASGTLLLLRMTPLPARTIVLGKLKAGFIYVTIFLISSLPVLWALAYLETEAAYWRVGAWLGLLLLITMVLVSAGLFASTVMRSTAAATALSYGISGVICLGTLAVELFGARVTPLARASILVFNPFAAALQITADTWFKDTANMFGRPLWQNSMIALFILMVLLLVSAAFRVNYIFRRQD